MIQLQPPNPWNASVSVSLAPKYLSPPQGYNPQIFALACKDKCINVNKLKLQNDISETNISAANLQARDTSSCKANHQTTKQ